jgi:ribosomal protein S18 acetylase RimI-like enzyme
MQTLSSSVLQLRRTQPEDASFLFKLFAESQDQLDGLRTDEALWQSLIEMQYRGRQMSYTAQYPNAEDSILVDKDGQPVGRLLLDRRPECWRIVDVAVSVASRGRGLGSGVLRQFQKDAAAAGARLELQVAPLNPARRLYERMGFCAVRVDAIAVEMTWSAAEQAQTQNER